IKHQFRCIFISGKERYSFSRGAAPEEMRGPARSTPGWRPPLTAGPALPERVRERAVPVALRGRRLRRSEEHTSELQSLMRISYAVFCLKKKKNKTSTDN